MSHTKMPGFPIMLNFLGALDDISMWLRRSGCSLSLFNKEGGIVVNEYTLSLGLH